MKTEYGNIAAAFTACKTNHESAEWKLGYNPTLSALDLPTKSLVLDFGCGTGNFTRVLAEEGISVIGMDASLQMVEHARVLGNGNEYLHYQGLLANQLVGKVFDAICATFSFCTIPDTELRYILRDMKTLLKSGGRLVILEPNHEKAHGIEYPTLHYHYKERVKVGDLVSVTLKRVDADVLLEGDIYRTQAHYRWLLESVGFTIYSMLEPQPEPNWEEGWDTERKYPPFLLITAL